MLSIAPINNSKDSLFIYRFFYVLIFYTEKLFYRYSIIINPKKLRMRMVESLFKIAYNFFS